MQTFWKQNKPVLILLAAWIAVLAVIQWIAPYVISEHPGYNGPIPWANHDGIHYLKIAKEGYFQFSEAFFPLYPLLIRFVGAILPLPPSWIGVGISFCSFAIGMVVLYGFLKREYPDTALWTLIFIATFPTAFFFSAVYTEGLFFLLTTLVFVFARRNRWALCAVVGIAASATKLFGVLLFVYVLTEYLMTHGKRVRIRDLFFICLMPLGLVAYMLFLLQRNGDPLYFFHIQPLFGANRSGGFVLPPQVVWRYLKILFTAFLQPTPASYFISVLEFILSAGAFGLLAVGWKAGMRRSYLLYAFLSLTMPTLTGTFSSMPRYILSATPLFFILGSVHNRAARFVLIACFSGLGIILSAMFFRGWFVA